MFKQTFSFCRRLLGRPETAHATRGATATEVREDRRLWVRCQADLQTRVQLADQGPHDRALAHVRDISPGGANLLTDRPFHPGQILSLELPATADEPLQIVLACVVRSAPEGAGRWSLGCVFARELSAEGLERFGARPPEPAEDDQRTWARHRCDLKATYQLIGEPDGHEFPAQVLNVSANGVGLLLSHPVEAGGLINVTLHARQGELARTILACVVHSTQRGSGELAVGCNFIRELAEADLQALL